MLVGCSCHSAVLVPVRARVPSRSRSVVTRVIVGCSYPPMLLLVRYSSGGRAATRPLLIQRPCCYSSDTHPAAVLLLVRYSFGQAGGARMRRRRGVGAELAVNVVVVLCAWLK